MLFQIFLFLQFDVNVRTPGTCYLNSQNMLFELSEHPRTCYSNTQNKLFELSEHPEHVVRTPRTYCSNTRAKLQSAEAAERRGITMLSVLVAELNHVYIIDIVYI